MIRRDLLILIKRVRLFNDLHDFLELLELAERCLLFLQPTRLLDSHLPSMPHRVIDFNSERASRELLQHGHFPLELLFLKALIRVVEELRV